tara:strand:+ start:5345 stop:5920 length:576 start_codon:yes stop_codon:yes gene_type:complete
MKFAFCLRGQARGEHFHKSFKNIEDYMINDLKEKNDVDVFINTYKNIPDETQKLINKFNPLNCHYNDSNILNKNKFKNYPICSSPIISTQIIQCCKQIKEYEITNNVNYDYVIITRFDLTFNTHYKNYNIDYDKINMECIFPDYPDKHSGDNFLLFHRKYLDLIIKCMEQSINLKNIKHLIVTMKYLKKMD